MYKSWLILKLDKKQKRSTEWCSKLKSHNEDHYFVMAPSLFRYGTFIISLFRLRDYEKTNTLYL